nr:PAC motif-containing protein [Tanacetum cinerariifolium]
KKIEAPGLWRPTVTLNTTSTSSSKSSSKSKAIIKVKKETNTVDYEIFWEDLITKEQIGQGSCGTIYHGLSIGEATSMSAGRPNSRGKAINESTASWTKVICLAIKFLKVDSKSRSLDDEEEPKWMDRG